MPRYKALSEDLCWVLVHMHHKQNLAFQEIERNTGVKVWRIQNILKLFHDTGKVLLVKQRASRPSKLNQGNIDVSCDRCTCILDWNFFIAKYIEAFIAHSPDAYLDELRTQLEEVCGVKVHESTVWRALKRRGFTLKKVSIWTFMLVSQVSIRLWSRLQKLLWSKVIWSNFNTCTELASIISLINLSSLMKAHLTDTQHTEIMHMLWRVSMHCASVFLYRENGAFFDLIL